MGYYLYSSASIIADTFGLVQSSAEPRDDAKLYKKYKLTKEGVSFIGSMIKPMG